jgi:hypothetical protein
MYQIEINLVFLQRIYAEIRNMMTPYPQMGV